MYEDRDGDYWVGTLGEGLQRLQREDVGTVRLPGGSAVNRIASLTLDQRGTLWVGTGRGVHAFKNGVWRSFFRPHPPGKWFEGQIPTSIFVDQDGSVLLGYMDQLALLKDGRFQDLNPALRMVDSQINTMARDRNGDLWLGGRGLYRLHDSVLQHFTEANGQALEEVREILPDSNGGVWATSDGGLLFFNHEQGRVWTEADGLSSDHVLTLYQEPDNTLWIGTADGGLNRFQQGRFQHITAHYGLYSDDVRRIFEDKSGFFWLSCSRGISRVQKSQISAFLKGLLPRVMALHFGKEDGFSNVNCSGFGRPNGLQFSDGKLMLPTQNGLAVLDPGKISLDPRPVAVYIDGCDLNHRVVNCFPEIRIDPGQDNLEIRYSAIKLKRPEQTRFRYQLSGLDTSWTDADSRRTAFYSHLPPGKYLFRVIAANENGVWNQDGARLTIVVTPPVYLRGWFLILAMLTTSSAIWLAVQRRISLLRQRQATQEEFSRRLISVQEGDRRRIASELHDSLGQSLARSRRGRDGEPRF